jgi:hypothetical protein
MARLTEIWLLSPQSPAYVFVKLITPPRFGQQRPVTDAVLAKGDRFCVSASIDDLEIRIFLIRFVSQFPTGHVGHGDIGKKKLDLWVLAQHLQSTRTVLRAQDGQSNLFTRRGSDIQD